MGVRSQQATTDPEGHPMKFTKTATGYGTETRYQAGAYTIVGRDTTMAAARGGARLIRRFYAYADGVSLNNHRTMREAIAECEKHADRVAAIEAASEDAGATVTITPTGWIVNAAGYAHFGDVYRVYGSLEATMTALHEEAAAADSRRDAKKAREIVEAIPAAAKRNRAVADLCDAAEHDAKTTAQALNLAERAADMAERLALARDLGGQLCLRVDGLHVGHMSAVGTECREEQGDPATLTDATHLALINHVDDRTGASVGMWRGVNTAPIEWGQHFTGQDSIGGTTGHGKNVIPPAPADLNDDPAWQAYVAALPTPTTAERAAVIAEYGDPYADRIADCRQVFADAARSIWRHRAAGTLTPDLYTACRSIMGTARDCIATYRGLTQAWARRTAESLAA